MRDSRRRSSLKRASLNPPLRFPLFGKRRRASSTETKQVKGMLPLRLFSQEALRCVSAQEDSPCELPQFGVRWCLSAMAPVACKRRWPLRCVYAQEDFPLRVSAGICRPSVACQRRRCLLANDQ